MTEPFAQFAIRRRQRRESVSQRLDVKTAAADDDRVFAARVNFLNRIKGEPAELFRVHFFRQRNSADQMVRHFRERLTIRFGREQIEPAINLESVGADDFGAHLLCNFCGEIRFARCSRTDDEERLHQKKKPEDKLCLPVSKANEFDCSLISCVVFARFRPAHDQLAAKEFLVVQFAHCALRFFHRQHLDESETFRALIVLVGHDLRVLHLAYAVEQLEQIALGRVEGKITHVKTRARDLDRFRFTCRPFPLLRRLMGAGAPFRDATGFVFPFPKSAAVIFCQSDFFAGVLGAACGARERPSPRPSGSAARTPRISPG